METVSTDKLVLKPKGQRSISNEGVSDKIQELLNAIPEGEALSMVDLKEQLLQDFPDLNKSQAGARISMVVDKKKNRHLQKAGVEGERNVYVWNIKGTEHEQEVLSGDETSSHQETQEEATV